jgi:hypothetical protein
MATADLHNLEVGTPVLITGGAYPGFHGTIARSYTIRFGHRMYDIDCGFMVATYYAPSQLKLA